MRSGARRTGFCTKVGPQNYYLEDELHIILKSMNLEIEEHSRVLIIDEIFF